MTAHVPPPALAAYAAGGPDDDAAAWTIEVHLEGCAECRDRLGDLAAPPLRALLGDAREAILEQARTGPQPVRRRPLRRWWLRWTDWSMLAWAAMTCTAILAAVLLDRNFPEQPSAVLLLAPVAPLAGLAVAWSHRANPNWEVVAGTARAGLELLLRRTLAVLLLVAPVLAIAGFAVGRNPALWLLPCLTFTAATLLLGSRVGVPLAAALLGGGWLAAVAAMSFTGAADAARAAATTEALLRPATMPAWAAAAVVLTVLTTLRAEHLRRPAG
ncbi:MULTISPECIES: zf-HC2 domain-containing protein [unclassified Micromonospora]|uniref:zf-HC2 domain-containing protein n=1 Tax=unclassified Micromonospora TaxID=2617518 RepID=UPI001890A7ED|nr:MULTISPECIES: zf-HC2 domain-containing protein [unclassified Micromonospora]MBF5032769.1 zf-HC2 domain-containing protein [Micromonospora sp. ANENR4]MCZ7475340.1 zf-HC2 domain-containing protein [Micromonospora sp. WMMC273]WBC05947.1 zf-HC2 domain-containing protein [Micromonospora sp. WMMA1976]